MKYAIVENGVVTNTVIAATPEAGWVAIGNQSVSTGDLWDGAAFSPDPARLQKETAERAITSDREALKTDNAVAALLNARPAQINTYIDNNVTNLAEAKAVLKILARAVAVLSSSILR